MSITNDIDKEDEGVFMRAAKHDMKIFDARKKEKELSLKRTTEGSKVADAAFDYARSAHSRGRG
jgi:hypothetical protein